MKYLSQSLQYFKAIFQKDKKPVPSSNVDPKEPLSRFIFESNKYKKRTNRVSPQAFDPPGNKKLSIYRIADCNDNEIWELSNKYVTPLRKDKKIAKARGDIFVEDILSSNLNVVPCPNPHPRHANIVNWPEEDPQLLMVKTELANKAKLVIKA